MSRRHVAGAAAVLLSALGAAAPAQAFLGLGGDPKAAAEEYERETVRSPWPACPPACLGCLCPPACSRVWLAFACLPSCLNVDTAANLCSFSSRLSNCAGRRHAPNRARCCSSSPPPSRSTRTPPTATSASPRRARASTRGSPSTAAATSSRGARRTPTRTPSATRSRGTTTASAPRRRCPRSASSACSGCAVFVGDGDDANGDGVVVAPGRRRAWAPRVWECGRALLQCAPPVYECELPHNSHHHHHALAQSNPITHRHNKNRSWRTPRSCSSAAAKHEKRAEFQRKQKEQTGSRGRGGGCSERARGTAGRPWLVSLHQSFCSASSACACRLKRG